MEEMGPGNKLQRQKKGPWSLGGRGKENAPRVRGWGKGVGKGEGVLPALGPPS